MVAVDPRETSAPYLQPWHAAIADPATAQAAVLNRNLAIYAQTEYGQEHGAGHIETLADFRTAFSRSGPNIHCFHSSISSESFIRAPPYLFPARHSVA